MSIGSDFNPPRTPDPYSPPNSPLGKLHNYICKYSIFTLHTQSLTLCAAVDDLIGVNWSEILGQIQVQAFTVTPGPIHQLGTDAAPLDFFELLWDHCFFDHLADETNQHAQLKLVSKPNKKWYPTTSEMRAFIGVNILMGIDQNAEIAHYWSMDEFLGNVGIQRVLPRDCCECLTR